MQGTFPLLLSIVILIGILYLAYLASKFLGGATARQSSAKHIRLLDSMAVGQDKAIAAVRIGERQFLLGITQGGISNLAELNEEDVQAMMADSPPEPLQQKFSEIFNKLSKK
ncbi:MAG: flagellar biosynthetic protein FliO [Peptostreptococcaceae bacterium]|nr:flagellar biosynthetic protein FliO [Peptostreptococcaceae bacterium]